MRGFDTFMKNPSWKEIYDNAPTDLLKEYYRFKFDTHPDYFDELDDDNDAKLNEFKRKFTNVEWQYLLDTTDNIVAKIYYKRMMREYKY